MHELSITQSMLDLVLEEARKVKAERVGRINLVIGELSGIVDQYIEFYFGFLSQNTIASGATLSFRTVPTQSRCRNCGEVFTPRELDWSCPGCQESGAEVIAGNELYLESIVVE